MLFMTNTDLALGNLQLVMCCKGGNEDNNKT